MKVKAENQTSETVLKIVVTMVGIGIAVFAYFVVFVHGGNIN